MIHVPAACAKTSPLQTGKKVVKRAQPRQCSKLAGVTSTPFTPFHAGQVQATACMCVWKGDKEQGKHGSIHGQVWTPQLGAQAPQQQAGRRTHIVGSVHISHWSWDGGAFP